MQGAELSDGLLRIRLLREVPDEARPRMIPINGGGGAALEVKSGKKS